MNYQQALVVAAHIRPGIECTVWGVDWQVISDNGGFMEAPKKVL